MGFRYYILEFLILVTKALGDPSSRKDEQDGVCAIEDDTTFRRLATCSTFDLMSDPLCHAWRVERAPNSESTNVDSKAKAAALLRAINSIGERAGDGLLVDCEKLRTTSFMGKIVM